MPNIVKNELEVLRHMAQPPGRIFGVEDMLPFYASTSSAKQALARFKRKGLIQALERNRYVVVPLEAGPEQNWSEDSFVIACGLAEPSAIAYWSALHYWNLTEQIPGAVWVQSPVRRFNPHPEIAGIQYHFVRVVPKKYFGTVSRRSGNRRFVVTDREKTLIDCLDRPYLAGGLPTVVAALHEHPDAFRWDRATSYLERFPSAGPKRRLGYLLEQNRDTFSEVPKEMLDVWAASIPKGVVALDPGIDAKGARIDRRWGIRDNLEGPP